MPDYDAVIFDSDGVLVAPPAPETQRGAVREAFRTVGVDPDPEHVDALAGGVTPERLRAVAASHGVDHETLWAAREHHDEQSQFAAFETGARDRYDDVAALADLAVPCGVVSNNHHATVEYVLDRFDLRSLFDTYYGREKTVESLHRKKPDPHYLDRALADLGADAALFVGDSASDVAAAHRAGVDAAFVRRSHCRDVSVDPAPTHEVKDLHGVADLVRA